MADIPVKCDRCGKETMVSEYADPSQVSCFACRAPLRLPQKRGEEEKGRLTYSRMQYRPSEATSILTEHKHIEVHKEKRREKSKAKIVRDWPMWALGVGLSLALGYLRYGGVLWGDQLDLFQLIGRIALGVLYVVIVLDAFKDDVFQGLLCLAVPGYQLYYLYCRSDAFYLRAVTAAALIAFGPDTAEFLQYHFGRFYSRVSKRLMQGV